MSGGLLAVLVLYLFLRNLTSTAIIGVGIPISLLVTFAPLHLLGVSLNVMSLGGLALGVGMLVDSSIVVLESIYRCREEGDDPVTAVERGTSEVRGAVWSSSLTSVAVFFPMVFVEGIAGQAFGDLGLAVVGSQLIATAAAVYFLPMLVARAGLGLGVSGAVGLVLALISLSIAAPKVGQIALATLGGLVVLGMIGGIVRIVRAKGTSAADEARTTGLRRFAALERLRDSIGVPVALFRRILRSDPARSRWIRGLTLLPRLVVAVLVLLVGWIYVVVVRFLLGTVFEWGLGKPILLSFHGLTGMTRGGTPLLVRAFTALTRLPLRLTGAGMDWLGRPTRRLLRSALAHPAVIGLVVLACFAITWRVTRTLDSELLPEVHQGEFTVEVRCRSARPLESTEALVAPIERAILAEKEAHSRADPDRRLRPDEHATLRRGRAHAHDSRSSWPRVIVDRKTSRH